MDEGMDLFSQDDSASSRGDFGDGDIVSSAGRKLEIKNYTVKIDSKGEKILLNTGKKFNFHEIEDDGYDSAMLVTKTYDQKNKLTSTEVKIMSPYIINALKEVIGWYPNIDFEGETIVFLGPPWCLFHYRQELIDYCDQYQDYDEELVRDHVTFAIKYMKDTFASDLQHYKNCFQDRGSNAGLDWSRLWMAYRPGELIFCRESDEIFGGRLIEMRSTVLGWSLELERLVCAGAEMVYDTCSVYIPFYFGLKQLKNLNFYPLKYHKSQEIVMEKLIKRGKELFSLCGVHQKYYRGHARWARGSDQEDDYYCGSYSTFRVRSRIMIDVAAFNEHRPNHKITGTYKKSKTRWQDQANQKSDEQYLICDTEVFGYSLTDKRWCAFKIDLIQHVEYSGSAFNGLLLPTDLKATLLSLVEVHTNEALQFGDLIQDKGKGMIFLLHGEPGTGKTLTAESICDYVKRPLYPLRSGDLGVTAESLEASLTEAFQLGEKWNAIILLDEADVFLEMRRRNELKRNSLVAVFLRALEYYEGIMFLTTNRIESFDPAFKSRIHLSMKYPPLCREFRRKLWSSFIETGISDDVDPSVQDTNFLDEMADYNFNGREIRNVVRTAYSLAVSWDQELNDIHFHTTLSAMSHFDNPSDKASDAESEDEEARTLRPQKRQRVD